MDKKEVFCKARYKHRNIPLEDCIPNPNHPACQGCHSPKIDLLKEEEQKYFRKKAAAGAAGKNKKKSKAEATEQDTVYLDLDEEPVEEDLLADDDYFDDEADV